MHACVPYYSSRRDVLYQFNTDSFESCFKGICRKYHVGVIIAMLCQNQLCCLNSLCKQSTPLCVLINRAYRELTPCKNKTNKLSCLASYDVAKGGNPDNGRKASVDSRKERKKHFKGCWHGCLINALGQDRQQWFFLGSTYQRAYLETPLDMLNTKLQRP